MSDGRWKVGLAIALVAFGLVAVSNIAQATSGSWVAHAPSVRVAVPGRDTHSQSLTPPPHVAQDATIVRVAWRYHLPAGRSIKVSLCHPARCIPLSSASGSSRELAGLPASAALYFRFQLASGAALRVEGLQAIIDYR